MANTTPTTFMNLPNPVPGVDPGPDYANNLYSCNVIIDQHDHSAGSGQQITPGGININSDLPIQGNNITFLRSLRFQVQGSPLTGSAPDLGCLYESGVDLYYNDGAGNQIRITQSGSVAGSTGTITGLPSGTASAAFSAGSGTFIFQQATSTPANFDIGTIILRYPGSYPSPAGNFIALEAPASLGTGYALTLPNNTAPENNSAIVSDISGNLSYLIPEAIVNPPGVILPYGGTSAPSGWLICDGSSVLQSSYPSLFAVIGTAYGSVDGTHFNLPDCRGMFLRGVDNGAGVDPDAASRIAFGTGGNSGDNVGSLEFSGNLSHSHGVNDPSHFHAYQDNQAFSASGGVATGSGVQFHDVLRNTNSSPTGITINAAGIAESRPINLYVNYIIKT